MNSYSDGKDWLLKNPLPLWGGGGYLLATFTGKNLAFPKSPSAGLLRAGNFRGGLRLHKHR